MKRLSGFSLMEMMIVLLIVSIVAAVSAPMVNRKMLADMADKSPWVRTIGNSIAFNLNGKVNQPVIIGGTKAALKSTKADGTMLSITAKDSKVAHLSLSSEDKLKLNSSDPFMLKTQNCGIALSTNLPTNDDKYYIAIGSGTRAKNYSVAIGAGAGFGSKAADDINHVTAVGHGSSVNYKASKSTILGAMNNLETPGSIVIGVGNYIGKESSFPNAEGSPSILIGNNLTTYGSEHAIGIGSSTSTVDSNAIMIGYNSTLKGSSIAIGNNVVCNTEDNGAGIAIGYEAKNEAKGGGLALGTGVINKAEEGGIAIGDNWFGATDAAVTNTASAGGIAIGANNSGDYGVAIGNGANSKGASSVALGHKAIASHNNSVAIGAGAETKGANQIVLGTASDTVVIPGKLLVKDQALMASTLAFRLNNGSYIVPDTVSPTGITGSPAGTYGVLGALYDYGSLFGTLSTFTSDRRLKNVGKAFVGGLEEIKKLEVFNYTFKDDKAKTPRVGVMAQDLQKIFPQAVIKGEDGFLRIRMEDMFYALVNAVKELASKFDAYDKKLAELEKQNKLIIEQNKNITKENQELKKQNKEFEKRLAELEKRLK